MADGRRTRGEQTRGQVIAAARRLFGERGYEGTSIEAVLEAAGVARGALYHHFASKAELLDAVAVEVFAEIAEHSGAAAAAAGGDSLQRLRAGSRAWLEMALDPAIQRIALLDPPTVLGWLRWRELDEQYTLGGLRASLRGLGRDGRIPEGQEELLAYMLLAALNEAALFIAYSKNPAAALETGRATVDTVLDRLTASSPP